MSSSFLSREDIINSKDIGRLKLEQLEILFNNSFEKLSGIASEHSKIKENIVIELDEIKIAKKGNDFSTIKDIERDIVNQRNNLTDTQNRFHNSMMVMEQSTKGFLDYLRNNKIKNYNGFQSLVDLHKKLVELLDSKDKYDLISAFENLVKDKKIFDDRSSIVNGKPALYRTGGILRKKILRWAAIAALATGLAFTASGQSGQPRYKEEPVNIVSTLVSDSSLFNTSVWNEHNKKDNLVVTLGVYGPNTKLGNFLYYKLNGVDQVALIPSKMRLELVRAGNSLIVNISSSKGSFSTGFHSINGKLSMSTGVDELLLEEALKKF